MCVLPRAIARRAVYTATSWAIPRRLRSSRPIARRRTTPWRRCSWVGWHALLHQRCRLPLRAARYCGEESKIRSSRTTLVRREAAPTLRRDGSGAGSGSGVGAGAAGGDAGSAGDTGGADGADAASSASAAGGGAEGTSNGTPEARTARRPSLSAEPQASASNAWGDWGTLLLASLALRAWRSIWCIAKQRRGEA